MGKQQTIFMNRGVVVRGEEGLPGIVCSTRGTEREVIGFHGLGSGFSRCFMIFGETLKPIFQIFV